MNKYDENKVLRSVARVGSIHGNHIILKADAVVGIHMWGKLDYLTNYCGYTVSPSNNVIKVKNDETSQNMIKELKTMVNYIVKAVKNNYGNIYY